jgi:hypothetical protein
VRYHDHLCNRRQPLGLSDAVPISHAVADSDDHREADGNANERTDAITCATDSDTSCYCHEQPCKHALANEHPDVRAHVYTRSADGHTYRNSVCDGQRDRVSDAIRKWYGDPIGASDLDAATDAVFDALAGPCIYPNCDTCRPAIADTGTR